MATEKVNIETATAEVNRWLDFKKVSDKKREDKSDGIETMIDAVMTGVISIDEAGKITHTLNFPLQNTEGESTITQLIYKPRLTSDEISSRTKNVKAADLEGRIRGYVCALTGQVSAIIGRLDTADLSIATSIAMFFI